MKEIFRRINFTWGGGQLPLLSATTPVVEGYVVNLLPETLDTRSNTRRVHRYKNTRKSEHYKQHKASTLYQTAKSITTLKCGLSKVSLQSLKQAASSKSIRGLKGCLFTVGETEIKPNSA